MGACTQLSELAFCVESRRPYFTVRGVLLSLPSLRRGMRRLIEGVNATVSKLDVSCDDKSSRLWCFGADSYTETPPPRHLPSASPLCERILLSMTSMIQKHFGSVYSGLTYRTSRPLRLNQKRVFKKGCIVYSVADPVSQHERCCRSSKVCEGSGE